MRKERLLKLGNLKNVAQILNDRSKGFKKTMSLTLKRNKAYTVESWAVAHNPYTINI